MKKLLLALTIGFLALSALPEKSSAQEYMWVPGLNNQNRSHLNIARVGLASGFDPGNPCFSGWTASAWISPGGHPGVTWLAKDNYDVTRSAAYFPESNPSLCPYTYWATGLH